VKRFRGGLAFEAHRLVYHPTLGWTAIKKEKKTLLTKSSSERKTLASLVEG